MGKEKQTMLFRQLFDPESSTYTYLLADEQSREAVIIDPVRDQVERDVQLIEELGLKLLYVLDTHVHADHITGAGVLRSRLGAKTVVSKHGGAPCADVPVDEGDTVKFGACTIEVRSTPGHTNGCVTYVTGDKSMAFTGDALLIRGSGRTDFQQGDSRKLYHSVREKIFTLPDETRLYPGHDYKGRTVTTVGEEKKFNARLGMDKSEDDFVEIMKNLKLAQPKKIQESVPENLRCGLPAPVTGEPLEKAWAPLTRTPEGQAEVQAGWVKEHGEEVRLIDVRGPDEYTGELGHIPGAQNVPLETLEVAAKDWDREMPIVTVCRSGKRSLSAAEILEKMNFVRVASMAGGMIRWDDQGFPAESVSAPDAN